MKDFSCILDDPKSPGILQHQDSMYPKVKVRQEEDPSEFQRIYVKDFQSNSPEHEDGYTPPLVRVPKSRISISDAKISSKGGKLDRKIADENKVKKKVAEVNSPSSVLPPRAVLSSPENDAMLRTKSKTKPKTERSGLKNHKLSENTHAKCKKSYEHEKKSNSWKP